MKNIAATLVLLASISLSVTSPTAAFQAEPITVGIVPPEAATLQLVRIVSGLERPTYLTDAGDGSGRLFVTELTGKIRIIDNGVLLDEPFLDLTDYLYEGVHADYPLYGVMSMAFHPDFEHNGQFFVAYDGLLGASFITRFTVSADDPNVANLNSAEHVLFVEQMVQLESIHHGDLITFGPDGYLYYSTGDGGWDEGLFPDPLNNAQNTHRLKGKILRLDVDSARPYAIPADNPFGNEVWQYGLRNAWRFSFDRATGDLYIGDVGHYDREEINFLPAGMSGQNFGWSYYEGTLENETNTPQLRSAMLPLVPQPENAIMPIQEYTHDDGCSVTGGYVYRGSGIPSLQGIYLYSDYCSGNIWGAYRDAAGEWQTTLLFDLQQNVVSFGEDERGELYVLDYAGNVERLQLAE